MSLTQGSHVLISPVPPSRTVKILDRSVVGKTVVNDRYISVSSRVHVHLPCIWGGELPYAQ